MNQTEIKFIRYRIAVIEIFVRRIQKWIGFSQGLYLLACSSMLSAFVRLQLEDLMPWVSSWQKISLEIIIVVSMVIAIGMGPLALASIYIERAQERHLSEKPRKN